jgi:hypothetical protein
MSVISLHYLIAYNHASLCTLSTLSFAFSSNTLYLFLFQHVIWVDMWTSLFTPPVQWFELLARVAITMDDLDVFAPYENVNLTRSRSFGFDRIIFIHGCVLTYTWFLAPGRIRQLQQQCASALRSSRDSACALNHLSKYFKWPAQSHECTG